MNNYISKRGLLSNYLVKTDFKKLSYDVRGLRGLLTFKECIQDRSDR